MLKALAGVGVRGLPLSKYSVVNVTLCSQRVDQYGTKYAFAFPDCITRNCDSCGKEKLKVMIEDQNKDLLKLNKQMCWHKWQVVEENSAPQKCEVKGSLKNAVTDFLELVDNISPHLFRPNWHRNVFDYMKGHLQNGYLLQVMNFGMNFNNWYQDEVQSTLHATMNFVKCTAKKDCKEIVTLVLVHMSDNLKHDSFLSRVAQNMTFNYLAQQGIPLDLVIQFWDNCATQYKSRHPFVELAKSPL